MTEEEKYAGFQKHVESKFFNDNKPTPMSSIKDEMLKAIETIEYAVNGDDRIDTWGEDKAAEKCQQICLDKMADLLEWMIDNKVISWKGKETYRHKITRGEVLTTKELIQLYLNHTTNERSKKF